MSGIYVIVDSSDAWINDQVSRVFEKENKEGAYSKEYIESLSLIGQDNLFGVPVINVISLKDVNSVKSFVSEWESLSTEQKSDIAESTLIVATNANRNSTRKLEGIGNKFGEVILSKQNSKDKTSPALKMLEETNLSKSVKDYILGRVGDDYDQAIPVIRNIEKVPPEMQKKIQIEDIALRMPLPPGAVPPWEIEKHILSGDTGKAIEVSRRINDHSHPLVMVSIMKNKYSLMLKIAAILKSEGNINKSIVASKLDTPDNYPFKLAYDAAKRLGFDKIAKASTVLHDTEESLKGGSKSPAEEIVDVAIVELCNINAR